MTIGSDHIGMTNAAMQANREIVTDKIKCPDAGQGDYAPFSNTGFPAEKRNKSYDSLELTHNQVHGLV